MVDSGSEVESLYDYGYAYLGDEFDMDTTESERSASSNSAWELQDR